MGLNIPDNEWIPTLKVHRWNYPVSIHIPEIMFGFNVDSKYFSGKMRLLSCKLLISVLLKVKFGFQFGSSIYRSDSQRAARKPQWKKWEYIMRNIVNTLFVVHFP